MMALRINGEDSVPFLSAVRLTLICGDDHGLFPRPDVLEH
jgi:hypothetical protein